MTDTDDAETYSLITKTRHRIELEKCVEHLERFCHLKRSVRGFFERKDVNMWV